MRTQTPSLVDRSPSILRMLLGKLERLEEIMKLGGFVNSAHVLLAKK